MDDLDPIRNRVREAAVSDPPNPWLKVAAPLMTGITEIGFAEDSEFLLVLSSEAREVYDCRSGKRVARDASTDHRSSWTGSHDLIGNGFGAINGRQIRLAGAAGGGLAAFTRDGWGAVRLPLEWPDEHLILTAPYSSIFQPATEFWKIAVCREATAFGFSYTGNSLAAATPQGLILITRQ